MPEREDNRTAKKRIVALATIERDGNDKYRWQVYCVPSGTYHGKGQTLSEILSIFKRFGEGTFDETD